MNTAFSTALSALDADSEAINVIGNNLANLNTNGFKASEAEFDDLMAQTMGSAAGSTQIGLGVGPLETFQQYTQGTVTNNGDPTDAAIEGNGFFVVDQNGQQVYTRDGEFQVNGSGQLVTADGALVQGWTAGAGGTVNPSGAIGNITVPTSLMAAVPTTTMSMDVNLSSATPSTGTDNTYSAPIQVIDSLGQSHTLTVTYTNSGNGSWSYAVTIPQADVGSGGNTTVASGNLTFNSDGQLTSPAASATAPAIKISGLADGAANMNISWNLYNSSGASTLTQFDQTSGVTSTSQNGTAAGQVTGVSIQNGGLLVATFSNGQQSTVGQLALANITNPQSLANVGNNELAATAATAPPTIGAANSGGLGQIEGESIESSNVDMATEFTNLLSVQRSYQAASRVITTSDELMQETVNLIHS